MNRKERRAKPKPEARLAEAERWMALAGECHRRGDGAGVIAALGRVAALAPERADAHFNLGVALKAVGRRDEAIACYRRAVRLRPDDADALANLGNALGESGEFAQAEESYRRAIALRPAWAPLHLTLGMARAALGRHLDAAESFRRAAALDPRDAEAPRLLGLALIELGRPAEAAESARRGLEIAPDEPDLHWLLGVALLDCGRAAEAADAFRRMVQLTPCPEGFASLGHALHQSGDIDGSLGACARALALDPDFAQARFNAAISHLLKGDLAAGWQGFESRWRVPGARRRIFDRPEWTGGDLAGKTVFVYGEQGLGDVLHFLRFVPPLAARGARVVVEVQDSLVRLAASVAGAETVIGASSPPPDFDLHSPLLSLPSRLGTTLENIPAEIPYLTPPAATVALWKTRLDARFAPGELRVGIAWQGNARAKADSGRSPPLAQFAPLAEIPGLCLISLQKGDGLDQLAGMGGKIAELGAEYQAGDFADTAAVMMGLDLIVSSDTSVANLAGALGRRVWIALKRVPDWRWLLEREDSPWYPTARLFRQPVAGDWTTVFARIAAALRELAGQREA